jgi:hypothetical protein
LVQGFGWRVGARAADEALEELDERLPDQDPEQDRAKPSDVEQAKPPSAVQRWAAARRVKQAERRRKADVARAEREIDAELDALKRKIND